SVPRAKSRRMWGSSPASSAAWKETLSRSSVITTTMFGREPSAAVSGPRPALPPPPAAAGAASISDKAIVLDRCVMRLTARGRESYPPPAERASLAGFPIEDGSRRLGRRAPDPGRRVLLPGRPRDRAASQSADPAAVLRRIGGRAAPPHKAPRRRPPCGHAAVGPGPPGALPARPRRRPSPAGGQRRAPGLHGRDQDAPPPEHREQRRAQRQHLPAGHGRVVAGSDLVQPEGARPLPGAQARPLGRPV